MSTEAQSTSSAPATQQPVIIRHEFATPPAPPAAAPPASSGDPKPKSQAQVIVGDPESDARVMSVESWQAALEEEARKGSYRGVGNVLKALGIPKTERDAIRKALIDEEAGFVAREFDDKADDPRRRRPFKLAKADEWEALAKAKADLEQAQPKLQRHDAYEKYVSDAVQKQWDALPEASRQRLTKRLPQNVDPLTKASAITDYLAERDEMLAELKAEGASAAEKKAAEDAAAKKAADEAKAAEKAEKKRPPSSTGASGAPSSPKGAGSLNKLEVLDDMMERGQEAQAGEYYSRFRSEINGLAKAAGRNITTLLQPK